MDALPCPSTGHIWLILAPRAASSLMLDLAARLALQSPLRVIDGGNRFNAYGCSHALARRITAGQGIGYPLVGVDNLLRRIQVARAFTCYQMLTLLSELPGFPLPALVIDLLGTFHDESVAAAEAVRILRGCTTHLRRLSLQAPLVVSANPVKSPPGHPRSALFEILERAADRVVTLEPVSGRQLQMPLF